MTRRHEWIVTENVEWVRYVQHCKKCGVSRGDLIKRHMRCIAATLDYVPDDEELNKVFPCLTEDQTVVKDILT